MESPEGDRIKATSSSPGSSPAIQESPFSNFISNLSPINSVKAAKYTQRFSNTQFPTPPPVFRTPRLDLQRETCFRQSNELDAVSAGVYGDCGNRLSKVLVPCIQKELLSCSPSGCVEDYLTDPVEAEKYTNSNDSSAQPAKIMTKLSRSGFTAPITRTKVNGVNDRNSENSMLMLSDQPDVEPLSSMILFETATNQRDAEGFDRFPMLNPKERSDQVDSNGFLISSVQHHEQQVSQTAGIQQNGQDGSGKSKSPKNLQNVEEDKNRSESLGPVSKRSVKESTLHQRVIRRHLLFEPALAGKGIITNESHCSYDIPQESENSALPESLIDWESLISSDVESKEVSSSMEATSCAHDAASRLSFGQPELVRSSEHDGSLPVTGPFPSGFSLSSIAKLVPMSSDLIPSKTLPSYMNSQRDKLIPERNDHYEKDSNSWLIPTAAGKIHVQLDHDMQDDQAVRASSVTSQYTESMKLMCDSQEVTLNEEQAAPCDGMMPTSENTDRVEELIQVSPKKKRKKTTYNSESEGCKRCTCKKSRCLKLYCECFAAGIYCIDSCSCESCFNKPDYDETVTDMRQQIESRNPLAFAPKIVNEAAPSPANFVEVGNLTTPASARHKRGCNCKKSKCLKKYCECFQANVGCSDGCRCEGCSNSYGKKTETKYRKFERWENQSHIKLDAGVTVSASTKAETKQFSPSWENLPDMSHLSPLSYSYPEAEASSASPNIREYQNIARPHLHQQSNFKSSAVDPRWHSLMCFTPQTYEDNPEGGFCSDGALHHRTKEDDIHETQKDTSTPNNEIKASIPNKKQVTQPQFQSQKLCSSSSPGGLQSGRKFMLRTMPSFPPLTPYSKSKDDIAQTESAFKGDPSDKLTDQ